MSKGKADRIKENIIDEWNSYVILQHASTHKEAINAYKKQYSAQITEILNNTEQYQNYLKRLICTPVLFKNDNWKPSLSWFLKNYFIIEEKISPRISFELAKESVMTVLSNSPEDVVNRAVDRIFEKLNNIEHQQVDNPVEKIEKLQSMLDEENKNKLTKLIKEYYGKIKDVVKDSEILSPSKLNAHLVNLVSALSYCYHIDKGELKHLRPLMKPEPVIKKASGRYTEEEAVKRIKNILAGIREKKEQQKINKEICFQLIEKLKI